MKNTIYIFIVLLFISCNSRNEKSVSEDANYFEEAVLEIEEISIESEKEMNIDDSISEDKELNIATEGFQYEVLSQQKLQEMYDLIALKKAKPEFSESIKLQLKEYTNSIEDTLITEDIKIINLQLKEEVIQISDSKQKMKLYFDIVSKSETLKDSVWAIISSEIIKFEGKKVKSNKIKFSTIY